MLNARTLKKAFGRFSFAKKGKPKVGFVHFGDFYRTTPISRKRGFDRGGAIDRIYIEQFLEKNRSFIKGRVLEVAGNTYTTKHGGGNVVQSDILHINADHPKATIIADLSRPLTIGENLFDCIVLTQTLQFIYDHKKAIENRFLLLKPGGYLLLTVPGISNIGRDAYDWYWSFTSFSIRQILSEHFLPEDMAIETFGNVLTATAFLYGLGKTEISQKEYDVSDPSYQVIVAAAAKKKE